MAQEIDLFKLSLLSDMINMELHNIPIKRILDPELKCKLKNLKKSTDVLVPKWDEMFKGKKEDAEEFGKISDNINTSIDNYLKELREDETNIL